MIHLGDITKINGAEIEPVDVITFGSPCQDLSVAGKRAGLAGERSGLFMEAVRIIKEMRSATDGVYPNFAVWENVPGAFSSNKGEDFRAVLEELVRIQEPDTVIPKPPKRKWNTSGAIVGNRWSLAWRVLDAQFWGVPQRRRRIALVMDFAGQSAPEILFERNGMQRDSAPCRKARKRIARDIKKSVGGTGESGRNCLTPWDVQSRRIYTSDGTWPALYGGEGGGRGYVAEPAYCLQGSMIGRADKNGPQGNGVNEDVSFTFNATDRHAVCEPIAFDGYNQTVSSTVQSIRANKSDGDHVGMVAVPYGICSYASNSMKSDNPHSGIYEAQTSRTLDLNGGNPACNQGGIAICEPMMFENHGQDCRWKGPVDVSQTVSSTFGMGGNNTPFVVEQKTNTDKQSQDNKKIIVSYGIGNGQADQTKLNKEIVGALNCMHDQQSVMVAGIDCRNLAESQELYPIIYENNQFGGYKEGIGAIKASGGDCGGGSENIVLEQKPDSCLTHCKIRYRVRRLTPLECERLQGYPDNWTNIPDYIDEKGKKKSPSDSGRYKALGNSIALPPWKWVLKRISAQFERDATLGSLFDGIGGFPLIWEQLNGKGSARWASEIEAFPIAVTKYHFGEE